MRHIILTMYSFVSFWAMGICHDIHVSVSDIELKDNRIEITIKTYLDDLQLAMGLIPGEPLPSNYSSADVLITEYIKQHINCTLDGKTLHWGSIVIDASYEAVWISIMIDDLDQHQSLGHLTWESTFLTDLYDDQTNIVNIINRGKREVHALNRKKTSLSHRFAKS